VSHVNSQSLPSLCADQLTAAKSASNGRAAVTVFGGQQHDMRQTVIALTAGSALHEHDSPGEASLQVLTGEVRLTTGADSWDGREGDYLVLPPERHALEAVSDAVVLLTVATRA
jgi:quercetin dioxygenase-like cupin family protein